MSLWGKKDSVYSDGTINVDLTANKIHGTTGVVTFTTSGIAAGDVITVGAGATYGYAVVTGFTSTTISIANTAGFVSGLSTVTSATYNVSQEPIYNVNNSVYRAPESKTTGFSTSPVFTGVFGVDNTELTVARAASGAARKYAPAHAGWVGVTTYIDMHGVLRVKTETFVAGSSITNDASDDTKYPDS
ncbi:MAG: hypothetical protein ACO25L_02355 [Candidatus Nanopelagicales bacterium]|nr:hypothetical protein [Synechococcus phage DSL-LC03]